MTLEQFLAAGLLRLSADAAWSATGTAVAVVARRKIVVASVQVARVSRGADS